MLLLGNRPAMKSRYRCGRQGTTRFRKERLVCEFGSTNVRAAAVVTAMFLDTHGCLDIIGAAIRVARESRLKYLNCTKRDASSVLV